ncbi:glutathione S-transferase [Protomyces lactucae-debilis]|uniref:Glutathione S-transferase n=1 Tax=Protomyces lactucae-debilis TaxID=2754530 RepID=A0A1Y2EYC5_PROLT|nr:glutathione S-transferase [Protomyces lactucae-debilis]ORY76588.1 glutathione S-transferase [Protomyces lactucae-debilis]
MSSQPGMDEFSSMTLYSFNAGPYPARVSIVIEELNLGDRINYIFVDLLKGEHKTPAFKAMNYSGTLPVLRLQDDTCISECVVITQLLDGLRGGGQLTGKTLKEQAVIHMTTRRIEHEILNPANTYFHIATPGLGPAIEKYQNKEHGQHELERALLGICHFNDILADREYIAADFFSMADICFIAALMVFQIWEQDASEGYPHVIAWHKRMLERPSVQTAYQLFTDARSKRRATQSYGK